MQRLLCLLCLLLAAVPAHAQFRPGTDAMPHRAVWVRVQQAHFTHTGGVTTVAPSSFDAPLLGVGVAHGGLQGELAFGKADAPAGRVGILDVDLRLGDALPLRRGRVLQFEVPLRVGFGYRRVRSTGARAVSEFAVQTLGLTAGLGLRTDTRRAQLRAAVLGGTGLATRSFDGTPGYGLVGLAEAEVRTRVTRRLGFVAGYRFRVRTWDLGRGLIGGAQQADLFDYRGHEHALHAGFVF